jgi:hypothetical protein
LKYLKYFCFFWDNLHTNNPKTSFYALIFYKLYQVLQLLQNYFKNEEKLKKKTEYRIGFFDN